MKIQIIGDSIECDGWPVATLRDDAPASVSEDFAAAIITTDALDAVWPRALQKEAGPGR